MTAKDVTEPVLLKPVRYLVQEIHLVFKLLSAFSPSLVGEANCLVGFMKR